MLQFGTMIVDFHTHIVPPRITENRAYYVARDPCFAALYSSPRARLVTAGELIAHMNKEEIDVSVVLNIGWTEHEMCVETNDYILESMARYPGRVIGFGAIQPRSPKALDEIDRCARGGMKGIGEIRPDIQAFELTNTKLMLPLVEVMMRHNLILLTHASEPVGHQYPGKGKITPDILY
ncbi:MAG: amidohydrolase family protein, partial [Chloroflexi bacterium]|nr:amidohydrolase family protein [Chloroflexota bacterium]